jgi:hypothetical protein
MHIQVPRGKTAVVEHAAAALVDLTRPSFKSPSTEFCNRIRTVFNRISFKRNQFKGTTSW